MEVVNSMVALFRTVIVSVSLLLFFTPPLWASQRFMAHGDGTVTDTGLMVMWAQADNQADIAFADADKFARYAFGYSVPTQYDNWRIPYVSELKSLFQASEKRPPSATDCGTAIPLIPEIELSCGWVWALRKETQQPVVFNFKYGSTFGHQSGDITGCRVLPVRNLVQ